MRGVSPGSLKAELSLRNGLQRAEFWLRTLNLEASDELYRGTAPGSHRRAEVAGLHGADVGRLNRKDVAAIIGDVLGRAIKTEKVDPKMAAAGAGPGAPALQRMFDWYDKRGLRGGALELRAILGREPQTLRAFFEELNAQTEPGSVGRPAQK
jgi:hypothetical protein